MKLSPFKFALATGISISLSFVICNLILLFAGQDLSLSLTSAIFHNFNLSGQMTIQAFNLGKLVLGIVLLFLDGAFIGYILSVIYNFFISNKIEG